MLVGRGNWNISPVEARPHGDFSPIDVIGPKLPCARFVLGLTRVRVSPSLSLR